MPDPGSSGSSTTSNAGTSHEDRHQSKKRKSEGSSSDPIQWLYDSLGDLIDEEYSQHDWAKTIIERLRQGSQCSAPNLVKIIRSALGALQSSVAKKDKECALLKSKLDSVENKLAKQNIARDAPAKAAAAKKAHEVAKQNAKNETLLLTMENVSFVKPFGKFDITLYSSLIMLSSKKGEQLHILLDDIENVIRVVSPTSKDEVVALPLRNALTIGKTTHEAIALKFKSKDTVSVSVPKGSAQIKLRDSTANDLKAICLSSKNVSQNIASLFGAITGKPIDMENEAVFRSMSASRTCIICHHKASHGILFPLKNGLLFGLKPLIWIPAASIQKVDFVRSSRYFELVVTARGYAQTFHFEMIEMDEESALSRYCSLQKFGQRDGKQEALYNKEMMPERSMKNIAEGIDANESSDDSDFVMDTSSASSIPEDYDSEVEETDDDDNGGSGSEGDDSEEETDQNSAAGDNTENDANENGLDAFAVVSGSDSDS